MRRVGILGALALGLAMFAAPEASIASEQDDNTVNQSGTTSTGPATTRAAAANTGSLVGSRASGAVAPAGAGGGGGGGGAPGEQGLFENGYISAAGVQMSDKGVSAGGGEGKIGVWVNAAWSGIEDDLSSTAFDGDVVTVMGGVDYMFTDRMIAGMAVGYENADVDTIFNQGTIESDGATISPYIGFIINQYFTVDLSGGYSFGETDLSRIDLAGTTVTGNMDWSRWFVAGNLNAYYNVGKFRLNGRIGYLRVEETQEAFTESDTTFNPERTIDLGQVRVGGSVGYDMGRIQPYVTGTFEYDAQRTDVVVAAGQDQPANDETGFEVGGGVRFSLSDRVTGGVEATTHLGRENFSSTTVNGTLRIKF